MLKHSTPPTHGLFGWFYRFFAWFNRGFDRFTIGFGNAVVLMIKRMGIAFIILAILV